MFPLASNPRSMFALMREDGICRMREGSETGMRTVLSSFSFSSWSIATFVSNILSSVSASSTSPFLRSVCCSMVTVLTTVSKAVPSGKV